VAFDTKEIELIRDKTQAFFDKLGFGVVAQINPNGPFFSPKLANTDEEGLAISIPGENLGLLIGFRGETLLALQTVLSLVLNKELSQKLGVKPPTRRFITLDVGDWRLAREEVLIDMAGRAIDKSLTTSSSVALPPLSSFERRIVHVYLSTLTGVEEWSEGEEPHRRIVIKAK